MIRDKIWADTILIRATRGSPSHQKLKRYSTYFFVPPSWAHNKTRRGHPRNGSNNSKRCSCVRQHSGIAPALVFCRRALRAEKTFAHNQPPQRRQRRRAEARSVAARLLQLLAKVRHLLATGAK